MEEMQKETIIHLTALAGLGSLLMQDTGAKDFCVNAVFPHVSTGKKYKAVFKLEILDEAENETHD
jgi:hypothetical protein